VTVLLDASAILAFLLDEDGADAIEEAMLDGAACSAANWSEVAQKVRAADRNWSLSEALLDSYGVEVEPVTRVDADLAAQLWRRGSELSLADRLCLATAERLDVDVLTADAIWGDGGRVRQIR
jgi:PIN domain nuclease of toxin-antitoxin system